VTPSPIKAVAERVGTTLNQRIRAEIEGKILSGEWPPGHSPSRRA